ncbi:MAG: RNA 3'-phosphate cyclase [Armatimonadetes bacterium]|nr:RNA 3'-phosphate cyclase [Armatimonadota bacterium]
MLVLIDGSFGEGGGQILRTSLSLSVITGKPVEIVNLRAGRSKPGLQPQHLTSVRAAAALCNAEVTGDAVGSMRLTFTPTSPVQAGDYQFDIGTAGATTLVAQTVALPLCLARLTGERASSSVTITGGTHVPHAPPAEYLSTVYTHALMFRAEMHTISRCDRAGYYPKGGGEIKLLTACQDTIKPVEFVERGEVKQLRAFIVTSNLPDHVSERGCKTVQNFMKKLKLSAEVEPLNRPAISPGAAVVITAECENGFGGFTGLGKPGKRMEQVSLEACDAFAAWWRSGTACDEHLADQLVLPMALAEGDSRWTTPKITDHLRTVAFVVQQFLPVEVVLEESADQTGLVTIRFLPTLSV